MKRKNSTPKEVRRFAVGDLVADEQFTGLVVGAFIDPSDGVGLYTVIDPDGTLIPMRTSEIVAGISREEAGRALDLQGVNPLNSERSLMTYSGVSPRIKREQITDAGDARVYLSHLSDLVQRNAAPDSRVFKAFAVYDDQRRLTIREGTAKEDAVAMVTAALRQLEAHFDELIDLVDGSFRDYPMASGSPRAEKKPLTSISPASKLGSKSGKKKAEAAI